MIRQYLPQIKKSDTVAKSKIFSHVNKAVGRRRRLLRVAGAAVLLLFILFRRLRVGDSQRPLQFPHSSGLHACTFLHYPVKSRVQTR